MLTVPAMTPAFERRFKKCVAPNPETGCHEWTGVISTDGYGRICFNYRRFLVHRVAYTWWRGAIPEDLVIDHLCRNVRCVNPDHLEPVTQRENIRRGLSGALRTHCANGHPWIDENIVTIRSQRRCGPCLEAAGRTVVSEQDARRAEEQTKLRAAKRLEEALARSLDRMRTIAETAYALDRPHRTIRTWVRQDRVPHEHRNGHLYVDLVAAAALSEQTGRRNRTREAA